MDVTWAGRVLAACDNQRCHTLQSATLQTGSKLSLRLQEVDVVAADIVLCHVDDGSRETDFTVVIAGVLGNITSQLRHLQLCLQIALKARKQHLHRSQLLIVITLQPCADLA